MSYDLIKSIKIDQINNKVFICAACNNVRPLTYEIYESSYFTKILQEEGLNNCEIALLKAFEEGSFQGGSTKYKKAIDILHKVYGEEYKKFDWRNNNFKYGSEEDKNYNLLRESQEFKDLLLKALNTKMPKEKYILYNPINQGYVLRITPRFIKFCSLKEDAKVFNFLKDAEYYKNNYGYTIEEIK